MKNLTYSQLIELAPKDRPFQIEVESNPYGYGLHQTLWAYIDEGELSTETTTKTIDGVAYFWHLDWKYSYKGTFTLIDPRYTKPEVLKAGQKVRIMESVRNIKKFLYCKNGYCNEVKPKIEMVGEIYKIRAVYDNCEGVSYICENGLVFPHYCVQPVEEEEIQEIPELENTLEQLDNLVSKAQDIISKYKK
jgi:hypothetical protein